MRRPGRLNREWWTARLLQAPAMAIAGVFVAASGMMSVTFGYRLGEPSGNALIFAAVAIGVEGFADLSMPLFWRRLRWAGRLGLIAFFAVCLAYKLEAAKRFAAENLGKRDVAIATAAQDYDAALQTVERLRRAIADNADARAAGLIQTDIDALLRDPKAEGCTGAINGSVTKDVCPRVDRLRGEFVRAKARDAAQTDLTPALTELRKAAPAAGGVQDGGGPVVALLALLGIRIASWSSFIASLVMAIVEAGAIVVPMLIGAAFGEGRRPAPSGAASEPARGKPASAPDMAAGDAARPQTLPAGLTDRTRRDVADLTAFRRESTETAPGQRVQSSTLYFIYSQWKQDRSEDAMTVAQFGVVLTRHLGLGKIKSEGKNWYLDIRLRHPGQGRQGAKHLRAVAA